MLFGWSGSCVIASAVFFFSFLIYLWQRFFSLQGLPSSLPWATAEHGAWSRAKAVRRSFFGMRHLIQEGYYKPFILPNLATGAEVILPMSQLRWLLDQPDHILSQAEVNREFLHADWTMLHPNIVRDSVHGPVIRREMTKGLDSYADEVVDEIRDSLKTFWGDKRQWHEVAVYDTMLNVISRISNRALVGLPLCRDEEYIRSSSTFARFVVITASLLNLLPSVLRPVLGPLITAYDMYHYRRMTEHIFPVIKARMAAFQPGHDYKKPDYSIHNDYIHWALHHAFCQDDPAERTPEMITKRLAVLTFGAVHSSVITITNAIFDIASSPASIAIQQGLREEVEHVTNNNNHSHGPTVIGTTTTTTMWKGLNLAKMIRLDSALRESMRLWGFLSRGVMKMVMVPDGMMIPSGEHLPFGAKVGVTAYAVHHDESIYPNALCFDPFRFSRPVESASAVSSVLGVDEVPIRRPLPMVKSTDSFMGFSHGRSICPGRFFAANQLKLLLAHISVLYDIEPIEERPHNPWLNNSIGPPISSKLRVRRRVDNTAAQVPLDGRCSVPNWCR